MQRLSTTVLVLLGAEPQHVSALGRATNVRAFAAARPAPALERAVRAWSAALETRSTYFVHDADPLAAVAEAWSARFDASGTIGDLEIAVASTLQHWRSGALEMPDYYLICGADEWAPTLRHFYLGFLSAQAPSRVQITEPGAINDTIGALRASRWWPDLGALLNGIDLVVPDQAGLVAGRHGDARAEDNELLRMPARDVRDLSEPATITPSEQKAPPDSRST